MQLFDLDRLIDAVMLDFDSSRFLGSFLGNFFGQLFRGRRACPVEPDGQGSPSKQAGQAGKRRR